MEFTIVNRLGKFDTNISEIPFRQHIAKLYLQFNHIEEALKEYLLLAQTDDTNPEYCYLIATLFEKRDRSDKAQIYYKKAIGIDPQHVESYARLGSIMYRKNHINEARIYLDKAIKLDPGNIFASFSLGKILKENTEYARALSLFEIAARAPEYKVKSLIEQGNCYLEMKSYEKAGSALKRAIKMATDQTTTDILYARYSLAGIFELDRNFVDAVEQWEKIFNVNKKFRDVAQKLTSYQSLRIADAMKDYLIAKEQDFVKLCNKVVTFMKLRTLQVIIITDGCQFIAGSFENDDVWLITFLRIANPVSEEIVRAFGGQMKELNCARGIMFTNSNYSKLALDFAENRSIDLFNKDELLKNLKMVV